MLTSLHFAEMKNKGTAQLEKLISKFVKEQTLQDIDFWQDYFSQWFSCDIRELEGKWENFYQDRNHVAHNKLIDKKLYDKSLKNIEDLLHLIGEAESKFEEYSLKEEIDFLDELYRVEKANQDQLQKDFIKLKMEESGVQILDENAIAQLFIEKVEEVFGEVKNELYYREDIEIIDNIMQGTLNGVIFKIKSTLLAKDICVESQAIFDSSEGSESTVRFKVTTSESYEEQQGLISFKNGSAEYDKNSASYMPNSSEEYDFDDIDNIKDFILYFVEEELPEIEEETLASFPCEICDSYLINKSDDNGMDLGLCFKCGHINTFGVCMRCEVILDSDTDQLCDSCEDYILNQ
jgi:hypothetical protein